MNPLIRAIPPALIRVFARPYVAGDSMAKAIDTAATQLHGRGLVATIDLLAEGIRTPRAVDRNIRIYLELVDALADDPRFSSAARRPTVSLKPSSFTTDPLDKGGRAEGSREAIFRICERARQRGVRVTVDMENSRWTTFTLDIIDALHAAGHLHVGAVIQTRLHRSETDLDRLPSRCRVRLVIGIYAEPKEIALTDKVPMKERLLSFAEMLLQRGHFVEFATHDEHYVRRFIDETVPKLGAAGDRFEVQMLYGVPRESLQRELVGRGICTRLYIPFARSWQNAIAYLRRRLDEYPAMTLMVLRNMLNYSR